VLTRNERPNLAPRTGERPGRDETIDPGWQGRSLRALRLPQWRIVAGCLYQTIWNVLTHKPARTGIKDYDLIYFDDSDLGWDAEDQVVRRVNDAGIGHLPAAVEVRNQARVHLWFKRRFAADYAPLGCADESLTRYASIVHASAYAWKTMGASTSWHHLAWTISSTCGSDPIG
jgi:hypothetical protein